MCGKIQDFEEESAIHSERVKERLGFQVEDFRMEYYGICAECRAQRLKKS